MKKNKLIFKKGKQEKQNHVGLRCPLWVLQDAQARHRVCRDDRQDCRRGWKPSC